MTTDFALVAITQRLVMLCIYALLVQATGIALLIIANSIDWQRQPKMVLTVLGIAAFVVGVGLADLVVLGLILPAQP